MDTNKKILIEAIGAAVVIDGVAISLTLSKTPEKADLSTIHTKAATEAPKETLPATTQAQETGETMESRESTTFSVSASTETYASGKISIQYPVMDQLNDASKKDEVNELLGTNTLSVTEANDIDEANDTLDIRYRVISVNHKRLTTTYTGTLSAKGAAHPINLLYSNTVDLLQAQNLGLDDFTDAYTMAGYVLSDDMKFSGTSFDVETQVPSYRSSMDLNSLTAVFSSTDSPLSSKTRWPESFSCENQGTTYFSLPIPYALGDYMLVAFNPITK